MKAIYFSLFLHPPPPTPHWLVQGQQEFNLFEMRVKKLLCQCTCCSPSYLPCTHCLRYSQSFAHPMVPGSSCVCTVGYNSTSLNNFIHHFKLLCYLTLMWGHLDLISYLWGFFDANIHLLAGAESLLKEMDMPQPRMHSFWVRDQTKNNFWRLRTMWK